MVAHAYVQPAADAPVEQRVPFLRKVAGLTLLGLTVSAASSIVTAAIVFVGPAFLSQGWIPVILMLGSLFAARFVGSTAVQSPNTGVAMGGFLLGTALQGVAMGWLILTAVMLSLAQYGNPLMFIGEAIVLVALTMFGMTAYLFTGPKKLSMVGGFLSAVSIPMLVVMVLSFAMPSLFGGVFGLILNVAFVGISAAGLLYSLNSVMHRMSTEMAIPASYYVTMGVLTLFWNILTLLMRLQSRD